VVGFYHLYQKPDNTPRGVKLASFLPSAARANAMYKAENPDPYIPTWEEVQNMPEPYKTQYLDAYEVRIKIYENEIAWKLEEGFYL